MLRTVEAVAATGVATVVMTRPRNAEGILRIRGLEVGFAGVAIGFLMLRFGVLPLLVGGLLLDSPQPPAPDDVFTLEGADTATNLLGIDALVPGYPATPEGQHRFMVDLTQLTVDAGGIGVVADCDQPFSEGDGRVVISISERDAEALAALAQAEQIDPNFGAFSSSRPPRA